MDGGPANERRHEEGVHRLSPPTLRSYSTPAPARSQRAPSPGLVVLQRRLRGERDTEGRVGLRGGSNLEIHAPDQRSRELQAPFRIRFELAALRAARMKPLELVALESEALWPARQPELALQDAGAEVAGAAGSEAKRSGLPLSQEHDGASPQAVGSALQLEDGRRAGRIRMRVAEDEVDAELDEITVRELRALFGARLATDEHALSPERDDRPADPAAKGELANEARVLAPDVRKKGKVDARTASVTDHKFVCPYDQEVSQLIDGEDEGL